MLPQKTKTELSLNLPFVWIDAAAFDEIAKENLVYSAVLRHDLKYKF